MAFVPDASVAVAWVLADEEAAVADLALDRLGEKTATVAEIFWHELRNLLLSAERRGRIDARHAHASMAPARAHRLSTYDASYLALAVREGCAQPSLDRRRNETAAVEGVASFA